MTEAELLKQLDDINYDWNEAKRKLAYAKKQLIEIESNMIEISLRRDKAQEALRMFKLTTPIQPLTIRELDIEKFRENNAEVCEFARERDELKRKTK